VTEKNHPQRPATAGDYEVQIKVRNGRILSQVRALGYNSLAAFCRARGLSYSQVIELVTMQRPAVAPDGMWRRPVLALAAALATLPEDLFTERQAQGEVTSTIIRYVDEDQLVSLNDREARGLLSYQEPPDETVGRQQAVAQFLAKLPPRLRRVLEGRYGLGGQPPMTMEALCAELKVGPAQVHIMEAQALKRAASPQWRKTLMPYINPDYDPEELSEPEIATRIADIQERARQADERKAADDAAYVSRTAEREAALQLFKSPQWERLPPYVRLRWRTAYSNPATHEQCVQEAIDYYRTHGSTSDVPADDGLASDGRAGQ
jgi:hypothetical protein